MRIIVLGILFCVLVVSLTSCEHNIAGKPIQPPEGEGEPNGLDIYGLLLGTPAPGSLPSGVSACNQLDSDWFDGAHCWPVGADPPNTILVQGANKDGTFSSLCGPNQECYLPKNIYAGYDCPMEESLMLELNCALAAYWEDYDTYRMDVCKCADYTPFRGVDCWPHLYEFVDNGNPSDGWENCYGNNIAEAYLSCQGVFEYDYCFNTEFIMKYYDNVFSTEDLWCSDQTPRTCLADPDCWNEDATQVEKEALCGTLGGSGDAPSNCLQNPYTTCVLDNGGDPCSGHEDFEGDHWQYGFNAEIRTSGEADSRYGCELVSEQFGSSHCCLHDPEQLDSLIPKPEWELAYELDTFTNRLEAEFDGSNLWNSYAEYNGVNLQVIWFEDPALYGDYPCENTPCVDEFNSGEITENLYQRCFACYDYCGISECCNGLDDDGDGEIDDSDTKCSGFIGLQEGGVCFD